MASTIAATKTGIGRKAHIYQDNGHFAVQLYATVVYDETAHTVTLRHGGWVTPTTARYINQAFTHRGIDAGVYIRRGEMFLHCATGEFPFENGEAVLTR